MNDRVDPKAFLDEAWRHVTRGVADKHAPARHPTFATVSSEGLPEARTVVLRAANREMAVLEVHTDSETSKVSALRQTPHAVLHVWVPRARMQIRLMTRVEMISGNAAEDRWQQVPPAARTNYGSEPRPGTPIAHADAYATSIRRDRFTVLSCRATRLDVLQLGSNHRRAVFDRDDAWRGVWVAP
ncbi:MAG: pyridoxamine 5'-phosphate oxidase family protein [Pseudomonadota bacterium]